MFPSPKVTQKHQMDEAFRNKPCQYAPQNQKAISKQFSVSYFRVL